MFGWVGTGTGGVTACDHRSCSMHMMPGVSVRGSDGRSWRSEYDNVQSAWLENLGSYNGDEFRSEWALHSSLVCSPYKRSVLSG